MTFNNINILSDTYAAMRSLSLVETKADFSKKMLGKGASYLTSMAAKRREPADEVIGCLLEKLTLWERSFAANAHCGKNYAPSLTVRYNRLVALRRVVEAHLGARAAFALPDNVVSFRKTIQ